MTHKACAGWHCTETECSNYGMGGPCQYPTGPVPDPEKESLQRGIDFVKERCEALIAQAESNLAHTYTYTYTYSDAEVRTELAKIDAIGSAAKLLLVDMGHAMKGQST